MPDLLQFQALNWHPVKQEKKWKMQKPIQQKMKKWWGDIIFEICLQIQGKYEIVRTNFEGLYSPSIFQALFFTEELLAKIAEKTNLYSSQIYPNKPMNCTVYGTQKFHGICIIGSLTPLSKVHDLWIDVLGRDLVKETVSKNV